MNLGERLVPIVRHGAIDLAGWTYGVAIVFWLQATALIIWAISLVPVALPGKFANSHIPCIPASAPFWAVWLLARGGLPFFLVVLGLYTVLVVRLVGNAQHRHAKLRQALGLVLAVTMVAALTGLAITLFSPRILCTLDKTAVR